MNAFTLLGLPNLFLERHVAVVRFGYFSEGAQDRGGGALVAGSGWSKVKLRDLFLLHLEELLEVHVGRFLLGQCSRQILALFLSLEGRFRLVIFDHGRAGPDVIRGRRSLRNINLLNVNGRLQRGQLPQPKCFAL